MTHLIKPQAVPPNMQMGGYANNAFVDGPTVPGNMVFANQVRFCNSFTDWNNFHLSGLKKIEVLILKVNAREI